MAELYVDTEGLFEAVGEFDQLISYLLAHDLFHLY